MKASKEYWRYWDFINDQIGASNTRMYLRAGVDETARVLVPSPPGWRWLMNRANLAVVSWLRGLSPIVARRLDARARELKQNLLMNR